MKASATQAKPGTPIDSGSLGPPPQLVAWCEGLCLLFAQIPQPLITLRVRSSGRSPSGGLLKLQAPEKRLCWVDDYPEAVSCEVLPVPSSLLSLSCSPLAAAVVPSHRLPPLAISLSPASRANMLSPSAVLIPPELSSLAWAFSTPTARATSSLVWKTSFRWPRDKPLL